MGTSTLVPEKTVEPQTINDGFFYGFLLSCPLLSMGTPDCTFLVHIQQPHDCSSIWKQFSFISMYPLSINSKKSRAVWTRSARLILIGILIISLTIVIKNRQILYSWVAESRLCNYLLNNFYVRSTS